MVDGANPAAEARGLAQQAGGRVGLVYEHALTGFQFHGSAAAAAALAQSPRVRSVEADRAVYPTEEFLPWGVMRIDAYRSDPPPGAYQEVYRGQGVRIGILDSGIDLSHPDLTAQIDLGLGKNCVGPGPPQDGFGHGTHVAGTAAAPLNGIGVVGVAPESTLVPIKVLDDSGAGSVALLLCGIEHLIGLMTDGDPTNDIPIANMSLGADGVAGTCVTDPLHEAICRGSAEGIIFVAAAGNSAANAATVRPAAYPEVIAVSALADFDGEPGGAAGCFFVPDIECDDAFASFSNFGAVVDVTAPGVYILSTATGGSYQNASGTSMAAPHVAGVIALMKAVDPTVTPAEAAALLNQSGECPNQAWADADGIPGCDGQGLWTDDPDGIAEPLVNALRAAQAASIHVGPGATFVPLTPSRLLDSRFGNGLSGPFNAGVPRTFQVTGRGGVPANATAVTGNLTATNQTQAGFVFLGPHPLANPPSSTLNFPLGDTRANGVTVALSATGTLSATFGYAGSTDLVFDVTGYFVPDNTGATYVPLTPARLLDSRFGNGLSGKFTTGVPRTFQVSGLGGVPLSAVGVTGILTATNATQPGFVFLGPDPVANPTSSTLNFPLGDTRANGVTVALSNTGTLSATFGYSGTTDLLFDVTGYFVPDNSGATFVPLSPARLLDSRFGNGLSGPFNAGVPRTFQVTGRGGVPLTATAVTGNLTATNQTQAGFVFLGPDPVANPTSSTLNFPLSDTRANGVTVALSLTGSLSATFGYAGSTDLVFDVTGYFVP